MSVPEFPIERIKRATLLAVAGLLLAFAFLRSGFAEGVKQPSGRKTVLNVWDWWSPGTDEKYGLYFDAVKREFEAANPDIELKFQFVPFLQYEQKMATALVGSRPPDVFQASVYWAEGFYDRGMLLPLNDLLARESTNADPAERVDKSAFMESGWRHNTKPDGTVFGIPQILDSNCLSWNLEILEKAAQTDEEIRGMFVRNSRGEPDYSRLRFDAISSWEQFRRVMKKLTVYDSRGEVKLDGSGEPVQTGFSLHAHGSGANPMLNWMAANGTNFQDEAGTRSLMDSEEGREAVRFVLDLHWKDHVSPPFRRQFSDDDTFNKGNVACAVTGTWAGKYITRNTDGKLRFDFTAFPPGPRGKDQATLAWGNMLVISRKTTQVEAAWRYVKFITNRKGALRLLSHLEQISPRKDVYVSDAWKAACVEKPYLNNIADICSRGLKLRHTQINATNYVTEPVFEALLLRYPEIERGNGPYPSVDAAIQQASGAVNRVFDRYNAQVRLWREANSR